jgi:hypothetical protein
MSRHLTPRRLRQLGAQLTTRDEAVIRSVTELRYLTGSQLTRLHFNGHAGEQASARAARRALLRLTRLDMLTRLDDEPRDVPNAVR